MEAKEQRRPRAYKVTDKVYIKAQKRGQREKQPLATLIEKVVQHYSQGFNIAVFDKTETMAFKIN